MDDRQAVGMDSRAADRMRAAQEQARYGADNKLDSINECNEKMAAEPYRPSLNGLVNDRLRRVSKDAEGLLRIQSILTQHPEFEQFIELQNLLARHGL
jgi:hypothetical protein